MPASLFTVPDSPLAASATAVLHDAADTWLIDHSQRTFQFGAALLHLRGHAVDHEILFVASMLHDLALGTTWDDPAIPFQLHGADLARREVKAHGADDATAELIHDAIALHLELQTGEDPRPEVAGVHLGAALDVIGLRIDEVPSELIDAVIEAHPRRRFKDELSAYLRVEADRKPTSSIALLLRELDFLDLIESAPFKE